MKKFLSVLLALAVAFTFTFGSTMSAFASATDDAKAYADEQVEAMTEFVNTYADSIVYHKGYVNTIPGLATDAVDPNVSETAVKAAIEVVIKDYSGAIYTAEAAAVADSEFTDGDKTAIDNAWAAIDTTAKLAAVIFTDSATNANKTLYATAVKEWVVITNATIASVDTTAYFTGDAEAFTNETTGLITVANAKIANATATNGATKANLTALVNANNAITAALNEKAEGYIPTKAAAETELSKLKDAKIKAIKTAAEAYQKDQKADLEAVIENTSSSASAVSSANTKLNSLAADVENVVAFFTAKINGVELKETVDKTTVLAIYAVANSAVTEATGEAITALTTDAAVIDDPNFYGVVGQMSSKSILIDYANSYAASLKNRYDASTGLATYNAATVDAYLADAIEAINALEILSNSAVVSAFAGMPTAAEEKALVSVTRAAATAIITDNVTADNIADKTNAILGTGATYGYADLATTTKNALVKALGTSSLYAYGNWDTDDQEAIKDIQKTYTKKIKEAANEDAIIALIAEAKKAMDDVALRTVDANTVKGKVLTEMKALGYVGNDATTSLSTGGTIEQYARSKNVSNAYATAIADAIEDAAEVLYDAVLAEKNVKIKSTEIQTILKNNYAAALAKIDAMKTIDELKAAAEAVDNAISNLPTTATLDAKAGYLTVETQYEEYLELAGATDTDIKKAGLLDAYMTRIIALEKTAVEDQIKALPKTITIDDQAAVEAARAAVDNYAKAYSKYVSRPYDYDYAPISSVLAGNNQSTLEKAEAALSDAKLVDAAKKAAAIPDAITLDDKATIEAARAAYDGLTDAEKALFNPDLLAKIEAAEKQLAALAPAYDNQDAKADLLDMSRKLTIWRTSKTSIKVTAVGSVKNIKANGYTVKYSFYKKNPGATSYKLIKTTTSNKYTYTNLKKGTNKFQVKVKVYDADGKLVATKMTYYRAAKVK